MKWTVTTPATGSLLGFNTLKSHLRTDNPDERDLVLQYEAAAIAHAENAMACSLRTQTITAIYYAQESIPQYTLTRYGNLGQLGLPGPGVLGYDILLPHGPVQSITSATGNGTTIISTDYRLERVGNADRLHVLKAFAYPLTVVYVAGYGTSDQVPADIKQAILVHAGTLYENRESVSDKSKMPVPHSLEAFYRLRARGTGIG